MCKKTNADIRKAQQKIGYAPTTNFQNGIKSLWNGFEKVVASIYKLTFNYNFKDKE